jgi:hypothetical protein
MAQTIPVGAGTVNGKAVTHGDGHSRGGTRTRDPGIMSAVL